MAGGATTASAGSTSTTSPELAANAGEARDDVIIDAVGPDRPTFAELVHTIRAAVGSRSPIVSLPGALVPVAARALGIALRDVLLTKDEYQAMAANLADTPGPSTGHASLLAWIEENGPSLGISYANELDGHFRLSPPPRDRPSRRPSASAPA